MIYTKTTAGTGTGTGTDTGTRHGGDALKALLLYFKVKPSTSLHVPG